MSLTAIRMSPSLRTRLVRHVLLPLGLTWLLGTVVTLWVAQLHVLKAYDRALADDALALSAHVQSDTTGLHLRLTDNELHSLLFDQSETVYFAVLRPDGSLVAGHSWLHAPPMPADPSSEATAQFSDSTHQGRSLRIVRLQHPREPAHQVLVAQTTSSRNSLLQQVLLYALIPQALLLTALGWWLRRAIDRDLQPLASLQDALGRRGTRDLSPVPLHSDTQDVQLLGQSVNALMARIEASVFAQREFAGTVAHELRTPLAAIRAVADLGIRSDNSVQAQAPLRQILVSEARASHMIEQLLALAFADESRDSLTLRPVDLDAVVRRVVLEAMPRADACDVDLGAEGLDAPITVMADAALVEGALANLIDNALRHGVSSAGQPQITVVLSQQHDAICLAVEDNGPGIAPEIRSSLLQRWQQAADVLSSGPASQRSGPFANPGVGLGLAIVSRYADLLDARFSLSTASNGGLRAELRWKQPTAA